MWGSEVSLCSGIIPRGDLGNLMRYPGIEACLATCKASAFSSVLSLQLKGCVVFWDGQRNVGQEWKTVNFYSVYILNATKVLHQKNKESDAIFAISNVPFPIPLALCGGRNAEVGTRELNLRFVIYLWNQLDAIIFLS